MISIHDRIVAMGDRAVVASRKLLPLRAQKKNSILRAMADELEARQDAIVAANALDMSGARASGLPAAMLDRLELTDARFAGMAHGLREVAQLKDPVGTKISHWIRPNGLDILKVRIPIGVIGIIY